MKNHLCTLLLLLLFLPISLFAQTQIMSYNLRYNNPNDGENWWEYRKGEVVKMIHHYDPAIMGIQEGLVAQVNFLDTSLIDYDYIGVGRDDGKTKGEYTAIFYKKEDFRVLETQTYWLSDTPDEVSVGWDAAMERIVTYSAFENKQTKDTLHVLNAHFDHMGKLARAESAALMLKIIKERAIEAEQIIVMGDLNCEPNEEPITVLKTMLQDSYEISQRPPYGPVGTFNGFNPETIMDRRIDYIFTKNIVVDQYRNIDDRRTNNLFPSDHLPVMIRL
ncbi:MAG: endonuclease/exonuclease/phosphatase family protein [Saprospiraceae bacterium]